MNRIKKIPIPILIGLISIIAYWQISFMFWTFKWDFIDVVFPWRFHVGECIQKGIFPFWNPYLLTGFPIHADLQVPTWYPVVWIVSSLFGYSIYSLHVLFIINSFIAGYGMYKLSFYFNKKKRESFIVGVSYMLCGYFVSHGQHFFILIAAAYIPWVIYFYLKLIDKLSILNLLKVSVAIYLLISGGYQSLTIITGYLLLIIFICNVWSRIKNRDKVIRFLSFNVYLAIIVLLFSLPLLVSIYQLSGYTFRFTEGINFHHIFTNPFSPQSLISFLFPLSTTTNVDFFDTDVSGRNIYIGLFCLIFYLWSFKYRKTKKELLFLIFGLICLLASFGNYIPVREFLANYFPLMGKFRMPTNFILFAVISIFISLSIHLPSIFSNSYKRIQSKFLIAIGVILLINLLLFFFNFTTSYGKNNSSNFYEVVNNFTFFDNVLIQSTAHVFLLLLFVLVCLFFKRISKINLLTFLIIIDLLVSVNFNGLHTVYSIYSPLTINENISKHPKGFPLPIHETIANANEDKNKESRLWRSNQAVFQKRIVFNSFTSLRLLNYDKLDDDYQDLKKEILDNYFVYSTDNLKLIDSLNQTKVFNKKDLFVSSEVLKKLSSINFESSENDTVIVKEFSPNRIELITENKYPVILTILQQKYFGWHVFIDGVKSEIFKSNLIYMSTVLNKGKHKVEFKYINNAVLYSAIFSAFIFLFCLFLIVYFSFKEHNKSYFVVLLFGLVFLFSIALFSYRSLNYSNENLLNEDVSLSINNILNDYKNSTIVLNTSKELKLDVQSHVFRFTEKYDYNNFRSFIKNSSSDYFIYVLSNSFSPYEVDFYIKDKYSYVEKTIPIKDGKIIIYKKDKTCDEKFKVNFFTKNNFEKSVEFWNNNKQMRDSLFVFKGRYSCKLDSVNIYSSAFVSSFESLGIKSPKNNVIHISFYAYLTENSNPLIIYDKQPFFGNYEWKSIPIREHNNENNKWIKINAAISLKNLDYKKDVIKIYVWNQDNSTFYIDNFKIEFIEKPI